MNYMIIEYCEKFIINCKFEYRVFACNVYIFLFELWQDN